jgi:UDP-N-acetylmuramoyl-tripeptide--D-alanyl-D-alanine ligase
MDEKAINNGIKAFQTSSNRLKLISTRVIELIDDSYNSNPAAVDYALSYLKKFKGRKIAVLGSMLELGTFSKKRAPKR